MHRKKAQSQAIGRNRRVRVCVRARAHTRLSVYVLCVRARARVSVCTYYFSGSAQGRLLSWHAGRRFGTGWSLREHSRCEGRGRERCFRAVILKGETWQIWRQDIFDCHDRDLVDGA